MGRYQFKPPMSGRMGTLYTLASIRNAALIEYGCMGHMLYGRVFLNRAGITNGCQLYSTHIDEADISLGDTSRLERVLAEITSQNKPEIIFLLPSSVPTVIGTDLDAISHELQPLYPDIPIIPFGYGGFNIDGNRGVEESLLLLAKSLPIQHPKTSAPTFNIIGSCADLFRFQADAREISRLMRGAFAMEPLCIFTSDTSVQDIKEMSGAHINLVIRREGEKAAKYLQTKFNIPYCIGRPYGIKGTTTFLNQIGEILKQTPHSDFIQRETQMIENQISPFHATFEHYRQAHAQEIALSAGGHADVVTGIRSFGCGELALPKGDFWCHCPAMHQENVPYFSENQWVEAVTKRPKGLLMASGEILSWAQRHENLQIANPDMKWRINPYEPPFVGYRGALHLFDLWLNAILDSDDH